MAQSSVLGLGLGQDQGLVESRRPDLQIYHLSSKLSSLDWSNECPKLCGGAIHKEDEIASSCLLEEIIDESETTSVNCAEIDHGDEVAICNSVTHIEIIKAKPIAPRRVSGANRVVPLITSMWQSSTFKVTEPSIATLYGNIIYNPDSTDDRECGICLQQLLSSFEVEHHVRVVHALTPSPEQCFVCRRKYVFQTYLKSHLSTCHGIQYPEMICKICFMEFDSPIENKAHERKHDKVYCCQFCSLKFASEYFYQNHFDSHLVCLKPFQCNKCGKRYCNNISLNIHQKHHLQLICCFCKLVFDKELKLLMHMSTHEPEEKVVFLKSLEAFDEEEDKLDKMLERYIKISESQTKCSLSTCHDVEQDVENCMEGLLVSVSSLLSLDMEKKMSPLPGNKSFECKLCGLQVAFGKNMIEHHQKSHLRNRTCLFCGRRSVSVTQTLRHLTTHLNKLPVPTSLTVENNHLVEEGEVGVNLNTSNQTLMYNRKGKKCLEDVKSVGSRRCVSTRHYSCSTCPQKFRNKVSRDKHLLVHEHETKSSSSLCCTICNHSFLRPKFLEKHMAQHNNNYHCDTCGKICLTHTKLRAHLRSHAPVDVRQKFKCTFCSVSCSTFSGLKVHLRIHTGERPYGCDQCKKKFKRLQAMKKHATIVHRGPDSVTHACRECPMKFNDRGNLFRHFLLIHRRFRRFICGICGHRYGQNQDLQRHLKMKHLVEAPSIKGKSKKSVSDIYVIPSLDNLPSSDSHAATIRQIVHEEKLKFKGLEELGMMENDPNYPDCRDNQLQTTCSSLEALPPQPNGNQLESVLESLPTSNIPCRTTNSICISAPPPKQCKSKLINQVVTDPHQSVHTDFQPQFIPLLGLLAQVEKTEASQVNGDTSFKLQTCDLCNKLFYLDSKFKEHVQEREGNSCNECAMSFCDGEKLQDHITNEHSANIIYQCGICMVKFSNTSNLMQQHMKEEHGQIDPNTSLSLTSNDNVNLSMRENIICDLKTSPLQLPIATSETTCTISANKTTYPGNDFFLRNIVFQSTGGLSTLPISFTHPSVLPAENSPPVFILQSSNMTSLQSSLHTRTLQLHTGKLSVAQSQSVLSDKPTSTVCFSREEISLPVENNNLAEIREEKNFEHRSKQHSESLDCKECGKHFTDRSRLVRHVSTHLAGTCKPFRCPQCDKCFSEKHNLKVHMRTHTGERPYSCKECGKKMRYQKEFADHKRWHEGLKPFKCKDCGRKFLRQRELTRHGLVHSGEKRFKCITCSKAFIRMDQLRVHSKSHIEPTLDELFFCQYCSKGFKTKSKLETHLVLHSGEKVHRCALCTKSFALEVYLKSHLKTHKKQDTYVPCPKCPRKFSSKYNLEIHLKTFHTQHRKRSKSRQNGTAKTNAEKNIFTLEKTSDHIADIGEGLEMNLAMQEAMLTGVEMLGSDKSTTIYFHMAEDDLNRALDDIPTG